MSGVRSGQFVSTQASLRTLGGHTSTRIRMRCGTWVWWPQSTNCTLPYLNSKRHYSRGHKKADIVYLSALRPAFGSLGHTSTRIQMRRGTWVWWPKSTNCTLTYLNGKRCYSLGQTKQVFFISQHSGQPSHPGGPTSTRIRIRCGTCVLWPQSINCTLPYLNGKRCNSLGHKQAGILLNLSSLFTIVSFFFFSFFFL